MKQSTIDLIVKVFQEFPTAKQNDRLLMWEVWMIEIDYQGFPGSYAEAINYDIFSARTSPETIRRCRQKLQEEARKHLKGNCTSPKWLKVFEKVNPLDVLPSKEVEQYRLNKQVQMELDLRQ